MNNPNLGSDPPASRPSSKLSSNLDAGRRMPAAEGCGELGVRARAGAAAEVSAERGGDAAGGVDAGELHAAGCAAGDGRFFFCVGLAVAVLGLGYFVLCVAGRVGSAWPLEWMEGASAMHAQRLLRGLPLYAAPRADFIPFVYPPLTYVPMGLGLLVSGGALWGARLASLLAALLCFVALWRAGKQLSGSAAGLMAVGLFAMGYGYTGGFIDLARVDAWFCALSLLAVERLCARRYAAGLLLLALTCLAKQHAVLLLAAASGGAWRVHRRAVLASWLALTGCIAWLCLLSDGWFWTYCVTVPGRHGLDPRLLLSFVLVDLCVYLPLLVGLSAYFAVFAVARRDPRSRLLGLLLLAAVVASALGRAHPGGDDNVRLPAYALGALLAAVSFFELLANRPRLRWPLTAALALQLAMLFQPPTLYWPTQQTAERFALLKAQLTRCAGSNDFAAMDHAGLGGIAFVHTLALSDLRMNKDDLGAQATRAVLSSLRAPLEPHADPAAHAVRGAGKGLQALGISSSFPELMVALAEGYELCARTPAIGLPTGYRLPETFVYRRKVP